METETLEYALAKQLDADAESVLITTPGGGELELTGKLARQATAVLRRLIKIELKNRQVTS